MTVYSLCYLGETLDQFDTAEEAYVARSQLAERVMGDQIPDYLTADDFEDREDCLDQHRIVATDPDADPGEPAEYALSRDRLAAVALSVLASDEIEFGLRLIRDAAVDAGLQVTEADAVDLARHVGEIRRRVAEGEL